MAHLRVASQLISRLQLRVAEPRDEQPGLSCDIMPEQPPWLQNLKGSAGQAQDRDSYTTAQPSE